MSEKSYFNRIYLLMREWEKLRNTSSGSLTEPFPRGEVILLKLQKILENPPSDLSPEGQHLMKLKKHLNAEITGHALFVQMVPFERYLKRNVKDADFLVFDSDRPEETPTGEEGGEVACPSSGISTSTTTSKTPFFPLSVVLDNIRSAFNVGSIFRTAECMGLHKIYLCGYTAYPRKEEGFPAAMGTEKMVSWQSYSRIEDLLKELKTQGHHIVGLETMEGARDISDPIRLEPTVLVLGNERFGLGPEVLGNCDEVRRIPVFGRKNSLNVGVSFALAAYQIRQHWF